MKSGTASRCDPVGVAKDRASLKLKSARRREADKVGKESRGTLTGKAPKGNSDWTEKGTAICDLTRPDNLTRMNPPRSPVFGPKMSGI